KTNQFNLTTRRYTAAQIEHFAAEPGNIALAFRLSDRLEDAGLIATILASPISPGEMYIDTWLMSCRVLGRQVEAASFQVLAELVSTLNARTIVGEYIPTARNGIVAGHYRALGFSPIAPAADGTNPATRWCFKLGMPVPRHDIAVEIGQPADQLPASAGARDQPRHLRTPLCFHGRRLRKRLRRLQQFFGVGLKFARGDPE